MKQERCGYNVSLNARYIALLNLYNVRLNVRPRPATGLLLSSNHLGHQRYCHCSVITGAVLKLLTGEVMPLGRPSQHCNTL